MVSGSWLPWESWSDWTLCSNKDSVCGGRGMQFKSRIRKTFSRTTHSKTETEKKIHSCLRPENGILTYYRFLTHICETKMNTENSRIKLLYQFFF